MSQIDRDFQQAIKLNGSVIARALGCSRQAVSRGLANDDRDYLGTNELLRLYDSLPANDMARRQTFIDAVADIWGANYLVRLGIGAGSQILDQEIKTASTLWLILPAFIRAMSLDPQPLTSLIDKVAANDTAPVSVISNNYSELHTISASLPEALYKDQRLSFIETEYAGLWLPSVMLNADTQTPGMYVMANKAFCKTADEDAYRMSHTVPAFIAKTTKSDLHCGRNLHLLGRPHP